MIFTIYEDALNYLISLSDEMRSLIGLPRQVVLGWEVTLENN